jgi:RimJ/RimL family protein N-acetyltransferase
VSVSPPAVVALRPAEPDDCRRVWLWRNDEETRRASFDSSLIPFETHERWFLESLRSRSMRIYIVVAGDRPSGVARLDLTGREASVSIHLAPECRGRGVGPAALRALADLAFGELGLDRLLASVKPDNHPSLSAFRKAGFAPSRLGATVTLARSRHDG